MYNIYGGDYMTITQAAVKLKRSEMTIRRWIKSGKIKAIWVDCGRKLDISQDEVDRLKAGVKNARNSITDNQGK